MLLVVRNFSRCHMSMFLFRFAEDGRLYRASVVSKISMLQVRVCFYAFICSPLLQCGVRFFFFTRIRSGCGMQIGDGLRREKIQLLLWHINCRTSYSGTAKVKRLSLRALKKCKPCVAEISQYRCGVLFFFLFFNFIAVLQTPMRRLA